MSDMDQQAAGREQRLDEREREADEREQRLEEREREADEREKRLREQAAQLRQRSRELRVRTKDAREHAEQAVAAATVVLEANRDSVRRAEGALERAHASREEEEEDKATQSMKPGERHPVRQPYDLTELAGRVSELREKTAAAAAQLAKSEDAVARVHEAFADQEPKNPEHKRVALAAREAARWARDIELRFGGSSNESQQR